MTRADMDPDGPLDAYLHAAGHLCVDQPRQRRVVVALRPGVEVQASQQAQIPQHQQVQVESTFLFSLSSD